MCIELVSENIINTVNKYYFQCFVVPSNSHLHHILVIFYIVGCKTTVCLVDDKLTVQPATTAGMLF